MKTKTVMMLAEDGTEVEVVVPDLDSLPTQERADYLRKLYATWVVNDGHWKGVNAAVVPLRLADDVAEAMEFMGATVDYRAACEPFEGVYPGWVVADGVELEQGPGMVKLYSKGYWAHGY